MPTSKTRNTTSRAKKPATSSTRTRRPGTKNFGFATTALGERTRTGQDIPFTLSDDDPAEYWVRGGADDEGLGVIAVEIARAEQIEDFAKIGVGLLDVLDNLFVPNTAAALMRKIKDPDDPFKFAQLIQVIEWAVEQVTDHPTTPPRT